MAKPLGHHTLSANDTVLNRARSGGPLAKRLGEAIHSRRVQRGLTLDALAERVGCTKGYLSLIERGRRESPPSADLLARLEAALELTPGSLGALADWQLTPGPIREQVEELRGERAATLVALRELLPKSVDEAWRTGALQRLVARLDGAEPEETKTRGESSLMRAPLRPTRPVPLINAVAAGPAREFTDKGYPVGAADEYVEGPENEGDPDAFACRVVGQSMMPEYREGDVVIFSPLHTVKDGMDCFVRLEPNDEVTFKRVFFERGTTVEDLAGGEEGAVTHVRLVPLNPAFATRVVPREQVAGLFAAVRVTRRLN